MHGRKTNAQKQEKMTKNRYPQKKPWKICDILVEIAARKNLSYAAARTKRRK